MDFTEAICRESRTLQVGIPQYPPEGVDVMHNPFVGGVEVFVGE